MAKDNKILVSTLSLSEPSLPEQATVGTRCNVPALLTLALLLIFAPLAFGGVHTWAYSLIQLVLLSFGLVVVGQQMWGLVRSPNTYRLEWPGHPLTPLIFGLIAWISLQLVPLPGVVVQWLSPQAAALRELGTVGAPNYYPLSLYAFATRLELFRLLSYVALLYLTLWAIRSPRNLILVILLIAGLGVFEILYGASQLFARPPRIWGWKNIYASSRLCGTFINCDHLAAFLEMSFFLTFGLFLGLKPGRTNNHTKPQGGLKGLRRRLVDIHWLEAHARQFLVLFLALVLATGLVLTQSRGGVWAAAVSLGTIGLLERARRRGKSPWAAILLFIGSLMMYIWLVSGGIDLSRLGTLAGYEGRLSMYTGTLALAGDFLLTGVGFGAFAEVFSIYQAEPLLANFVDAAHSDWLQLMAETGVVGFLLVLGSFLYYLHYLWKHWRKRQDNLALGIGLGCIGALLSVGFHAALEFPLHIPANSLLLAVVVALGFLAVHLHRQPWSYFSYPTRIFQMSRRRGWIFAGHSALALLLLMLALAVWHHWAAERLAPSEMDSTRGPVTYTIPEIKAAMAKSPGNAAYPALLALELQKEAEATQGDTASKDIIRQLYEQTVQLNPAQWRYHYDLGWFLLADQGPDRAACLLQGLEELEITTRLYPHSGFTHLGYGMALHFVEQYYAKILSANLRGRWREELQIAVEKDKTLRHEANDIPKDYDHYPLR